MAEHFDEFYLPFDSTGAAVTNFQSSQHTIIAAGDGHYQQITPRYGLFFREGLVVTHVETNTPLVLGRDFYPSYYARWMYDQYKKDCYAGIVLLNKTLTGNLTVAAHWVGGDFANSLDGLIPALVNEQDVQKVAFWDSILDAPTEFNPITHGVAAVEISTGFDDMVNVLWAINDSIIKLTELDSTVNMNQVNGLAQALLRKLDNDTYTQRDRGFSRLENPKYIRIDLPKPDSPGLWIFNIRLYAPAGKSSANKDIMADAIDMLVVGQLSSSPTTVGWSNSYVFLSNTDKVLPVKVAYEAAAKNPQIFIDLQGLFKEKVNHSSNPQGTYIKECLVHIEKVTFVGTDPGKMGAVNAQFPIVAEAVWPTGGYEPPQYITGTGTGDGGAAAVKFTVITDPNYGKVTPLVGNAGYLFDCALTGYAPKFPTLDDKGEPIADGTVIAAGVYAESIPGNEVALTPAAGVTINGRAEPLILNNSYCTIWFNYIAAKKDWRIVNGIGEGNGQVMNTLIRARITHGPAVGVDTFLGPDPDVKLTKDNCDVVLNGALLYPQLPGFTGDYKINADGTVTLINAAGAPYPLATESDRLLITLYNGAKLADDPGVLALKTEVATLKANACWAAGSFWITDAGLVDPIYNAKNVKNIRRIATGQYEVTFTDPVLPNKNAPYGDMDVFVEVNAKSRISSVSNTTVDTTFTYTGTGDAVLTIGTHAQQATAARVEASLVQFFIRPMTNL